MVDLSIKNVTVISYINKMKGIFLKFNIRASQTYLPEEYKVKSNELDIQLGLNQNTIKERSGISSRYIFPVDYSQSKAMANCIRVMLTDNKIDINEIDLIICANAVPEQALPNTASALLHNLELNIACFDVNLSCLSFISAVQLATSLISTKQYKNIIIASSDMPHKCLNFNDPESSYIFGDGCTAILMSEGAETQLLGTELKTYSENRDYCQIKMGGTLHNVNTGFENDFFYFKMDGKKLFRTVAQHVTEVIDNLLEKTKTNKEDIRYVLPHQASHLGMLHIVKKLGFTEQQVVNIYEEHGNQVATSLPTVLNHTMKHNNLKKGDKILLLGTGAGLTIGAALWQF